MNIEESKKILDKFVTEHKLFNIKHSDGLEEAIETLLTAYEKEKRLAEANLKDSEEFQDNMCNHRCILNSKVEELEAELKKEEEKNKEYKDMIIRHKKWEDKIKAKIQEVEQWELYNMKIPRLSTLDERLGAKIGIKYVLQSLLEKE